MLLVRSGGEGALGGDLVNSRHRGDMPLVMDGAEVVEHKNIPPIECVLVLRESSHYRCRLKCDVGRRGPFTFDLVI